MASADLSPALKKTGPARFAAPGLAGAVFGLTLLAYWPALEGTPLWDDAAHLTSPALQSWHGLRQIWFQLGATQQYYPVLHSAFWLEHKLWGDAVIGYHLVNVLLHATAACLFALLLGGLRREENGQSRWPGVEWLAAGVFALHPVCVESVAWISEQKNTLSLVFYLLAALAYLRFDRDRRALWYGLASGLFLLALLSKSVTATLPAALLLLHYWRRGRLEMRRDLVPLVPWFVVGLTAGLFTAWVERTYIGGKAPAYELDFVQRTFLAGRALWFYLGQLVWPSNLMFIYPRWQVATTWPWSLGSVAFAVTLGALWWLRHWNRAPLVTVLCFAGSLFPALGFVYVYPFIFSYVADHWQYLPCLAIIALGTESAASFARHLSLRLTASHQWMIRASFALVAASGFALLFTLTWRQSGIYRDVAVLYNDTLAKNPACWMAHNNLGLHLLDSGDHEKAIGHFNEAIRLKPDQSDSYNNLGNALAKIPQRQSEAVAALETALRLEPDMPQVHSNLGGILIKDPKRFDEGVAHLQRALQLDPNHAGTHLSLGIALTQLPDRLPEAIAEYEAALRLNPALVDASNNLGNALVSAGRVTDAIALLEQVRQQQPHDAKARFNLGTAYAHAGRATEAVAEFERTLQIEPNNADAHNNLGIVLLQLSHAPEAITHFRTALQLNPHSAESHFNLGRALRKMDDWNGAIVEYREALRLAPQVPEIWNSLGSALLQLERSAEAVAAYAEAVRLRPDSAPFHNNLGLALNEAGRRDDAVHQFKTALQLAPDFADAHYNLALALQQAGQTAEAAAEFSASGRQP